MTNIVNIKSYFKNKLRSFNSLPYLTKQPVKNTWENEIHIKPIVLE